MSRFRAMVSIFCVVGCFSTASTSASTAQGPLQIATFTADVTPPIGSPLCFGGRKSAESVEEALSARGVVLFGGGEPIVLCVADFVVLANQSHDAWREALAEAAGTVPERVAMHVLHNHDSPGYDLGAMIELENRGLPDVSARRDVHERSIRDTASAIRESLLSKQPVTHVGLGKGLVEKFASNRRIIGEDGRLALARMSSCRNEKAIAAPEGIIDPELSLIAFWNDEIPIAALTFYASHPQSYYGKGGVTPDTVGLARNRRTDETGAMHIHFDGAGGDVAAGKYNNGSPEARVALVERAHAGMAAAWEAQVKTPVSAFELSWEVKPVRLPKGHMLDEEKLIEELSNPDTPVKDRVRAARDWVYLERWKDGRTIDIGLLQLGNASALFFPGELFVEYQLAAKAMRPDNFIAVAAYGDGGPGYIGTDVSYGQGGYEVGRVSLTAPGAEKILHEAMQLLLDVDQTP